MWYALFKKTAELRHDNKADGWMFLRFTSDEEEVRRFREYMTSELQYPSASRFRPIAFKVIPLEE